MTRCKLSNAGFQKYLVRNYKGELLGRINYWKKWKKYVWEQESRVMMSESCLREVAGFLKKLDGAK